MVHIGLSLGHGTKCGGQKSVENTVTKTWIPILATLQQPSSGLEENSWKKKKYVSYTSIYLMLSFKYFYNDNSKMEILIALPTLC